MTLVQDKFWIFSRQTVLQMSPQCGVSSDFPVLFYPLSINIFVKCLDDKQLAEMFT